MNKLQKDQMKKAEVKLAFKSVNQKILFLSKLPVAKKLAMELSDFSKRTECIGNMYDLHFNNISLKQRLFFKRGHKVLYEMGVELKRELVRKYEWINNEKSYYPEIIDAYASAINVLQKLLEDWLERLNPESQYSFTIL